MTAPTMDQCPACQSRKAVAESQATTVVRPATRYVSQRQLTICTWEPCPAHNVQGGAR